MILKNKVKIPHIFLFSALKEIRSSNISCIQLRNKKKKNIYKSGFNTFIQNYHTTTESIKIETKSRHLFFSLNHEQKVVILSFYFLMCDIFNAQHPKKGGMIRLNDTPFISLVQYGSRTDKRMKCVNFFF